MIVHSAEAGGVCQAAVSEDIKLEDEPICSFALASFNTVAKHRMRGSSECNLLQRWSREGSENARHV